jgi:hypothetical protein
MLTPILHRVFSLFHTSTALFSSDGVTLLGKGLNQKIPSLGILLHEIRPDIVQLPLYGLKQHLDTMRKRKASLRCDGMSWMSFMNQKDDQLFEDGRQGLLHALADAPEPKIRRYTAFLLGQRGDPEDIPFLVKALSDPDKQVREQVTRVLVNFGEVAVQPLLNARFPDCWVARYRVTEALGLIGDPLAVPQLIELTHDPKDHVRYMAAKSLGLINDERGFVALTPLLMDENGYVRRIAQKSIESLEKGL